VQKYWALLFGAVILAEAGLFLVAPLVDGWWLPHNLCSFGPRTDGLFYIILAITGFFFLLTEGIMVYALWKYTAQPGQKSAYTHGSHKLELAWTIVPAVILLIIAIAQVRAWEDIKYISRMPKPDQVFEVAARQFEWGFRYPTSKQNADMLKEWGQNEKGEPEPGRESSLAAEWQRTPHADDVHLANEVHTWKGAKVRFYLKSRDVIHSFFLPNMRIKQDALPGKVIPVWFDTAGEKVEANCRKSEKTDSKGEKQTVWLLYEDKAKEAELACAELCGWGHYKMRGIVYIHESIDDYEDWLKHASAEERRTKP